MDTSGIRSLLLFLALGGGIAYFWDRNKRSDKFESAKAEVASITGTIAQRQSEIAFLEKNSGRCVKPRRKRSPRTCRSCRKRSPP